MIVDPDEQHNTGFVENFTDKFTMDICVQEISDSITSNN